jgi:hypothetical protein
MIPKMSKCVFSGQLIWCAGCPQPSRSRLSSIFIRIQGLRGFKVGPLAKPANVIHNPGKIQGNSEQQIFGSDEQ